MLNNDQDSGLTMRPQAAVGKPSHTFEPNSQDPQLVTKLPSWVPHRGAQVHNATVGWILEGRLGDGGAGEVWLGRNGTKVRAFKFFHDDSNARLLYEREENNLSFIEEKLKTLPAGAGEHVVMVHDMQFKKAPYWLSFDYIEGGTLEDLMLRKKGPMSWEETWELLQPVLECMAVVHEQGVVHRDLKPANILLTNKQRPYKPRITDFGIGKALTGGTTPEQPVPYRSVPTLVGIGTYGYMCREQARSEAAHTSDDVYALAIILWQMLAGTTPDRKLPELVYPGDIDKLKVASRIKNAIRDCVFLPRVQRPHDARVLLKRLRQQMAVKKLLYPSILLVTTGLAASLVLANKSLLATIALPSMPSISIPMPVIKWPGDMGGWPGYPSVTEVPPTTPLPQPNKIIGGIVTVVTPEPIALPASKITSDTGTAAGRFVKIDATGKILPNDAKNWVCVHDTTTSLMWEVKTDDGGLRDKDRTYALAAGGKTTTVSGKNCVANTKCDTASYVKAINNQGLCGVADWRMPEREELRSIVDYGRSDPAIDTGFFPYTPASMFWSVSASVDSTDAPWYINFFNGADEYISLDPAQHLRLVRKED